MEIVAVVVLFPGCMFFDVAPSVTVLSQFGKVLMAGPTNEPVTDACGVTIVPNITYAQVTALTPQFIIVPGGNTTTLSGNPLFLDIVKHATDCGIWLTAIGSGVDSLRQFGLKGQIPSEENVLIAENFVAAQHWANIEFAMTLGIVGGLLTPESAARKTDEFFGKPSRFSN
jgi:putative intracellular protease/amidase